MSSSGRMKQLSPSPRRGRVDGGSPYPGPDDSKGGFGLPFERDEKSSNEYGATITTHSRAGSSRRTNRNYVLFIISGLLALLWVVSFPLRHGYHGQHISSTVTTETQDAIEYWDLPQEVQEVQESGNVEVVNEVEVEGVKVQFKTNNLTDEVGWDEYSLFVRGQRIFLQ